MAKPPFEQRGKIRSAMAWLESELDTGPQNAGLLLARGELHGHARRTLQLAATRLHVERTRAYGAGAHRGMEAWEWSLK